MAFTSIAALAGGAEMSATLIIGAIAEAGTAMSVVGAVTGNKDLMKIGGVMSLGAGVAGWAGVGGAAAGTVGSAADLATSAASPTAWNAAGVAGSDAISAGSDAISAGSGALSAGSGALDGASSLGGAASNGMADAANSFGINDPGSINGAQSSINGAQSSIIDPSGATSAQTPLLGVGGQPLTASASTADSTAASALTNGQAASAVNTNVSGQTAAGGMGPQQANQNSLLYGAPGNGMQGKSTSDSFLSGVGKFLTDPANRNMIGQLGSGALSGMSRSYEADRNYAINKDLLSIKQTQQGWGNSAAKYGYGIVNGPKG